MGLLSAPPARFVGPSPRLVGRYPSAKPPFLYKLLILTLALLFSFSFPFFFILTLSQLRWLKNHRSSEKSVLIAQRGLDLCEMSSDILGDTIFDFVLWGSSLSSSFWALAEGMKKVIEFGGPYLLQLKLFTRPRMLAAGQRSEVTRRTITYIESQSRTEIFVMPTTGKYYVRLRPGWMYQRWKAARQPARESCKDETTCTSIQRRFSISTTYATHSM